MCFGPMNNQLDFGDDPYYDPDPGPGFSISIRISRICITILPEVCFGTKTNSLNFGDNPDYGQ